MPRCGRLQDPPPTQLRSSNSTHINDVARCTCGAPLCSPLWIEQCSSEASATPTSLSTRTDGSTRGSPCASSQVTANEGTEDQEGKRHALLGRGTNTTTYL